MQHLHKKKSWKAQSSEETPEEHSIDFHVEMINKIDKLLEDHDLEAPVEEQPLEPIVNAVPPQAPVEIRPQLNKKLGHIEIECAPHIEPFLMRNIPSPEEFRTALSPIVTPAFKYVSNLEYQDENIPIKERPQERVEIIDLSSFMFDETSSEKPLFPSFGKKSNKKTEHIITGKSKDKTWDNAFFAAMEQSEEKQERSQLYYLISKNQKEKKLKKMELEHSYIPVDLEERTKQLKEQQEEAEEELEEIQTKEGEKARKKQEKEEEKMEKQMAKKTKTEEPKPQKKVVKSPPEEQVTPVNNKEAKKLEKERLKLEKLEAKKQKIEEKKRLKAEKQALKQQQKHTTTTKTKEKPVKEKKGSLGLFKKSKPEEEPVLLDDDVRKVLLMTDTLLGDLPADVIDRFTQSEDFELYEKVLSRYKIK